jgi:uncharacterized protein (UPF0210 family)
MPRPFRIRTITAFLTLNPLDFHGGHIEGKLEKCATLLRAIENRLKNDEYEVQTIRIATNPFGEWLLPTNEGGISDEIKSEVISRLQKLNLLLAKHEINFCSLGPSTSPEHTTTICPLIVSLAPGRFSCSANINSCDVAAANAAAACVKLLSSRKDMEARIKNTSITADGIHLDGGLGNFRFCSASYVNSGIPFFPAAKASSSRTTDDNCISFALGLENGRYAGDLLKEAKSIVNVQRVFTENWRTELLPIQNICEEYVSSAGNGSYAINYLGIDTSLNPSLDHSGSVARAIEHLDEVRDNFGYGSLSAAAAVTTALQTIPDIKTTGYCGLMLPVLEDRRLSELGMTNETSRIDIQKLLCISSVCGVGVDTVPVPGDVTDANLSSLMLDVAALAGRWNKQLSCRVFPVANKGVGEMTIFDSPYLCNSCVFEL